MERVGIREAGRRTGLKPHTLRYYERIGLILHIERDDAGHRLYDDSALSWLVFLTKLRATGMSIQQMCRYADMVREGQATVDARREMLEEHRADVVARIEELTGLLDVLDFKINMYRKGAMP